MGTGSGKYLQTRTYSAWRVGGLGAPSAGAARGKLCQRCPGDAQPRPQGVVKKQIEFWWVFVAVSFPARYSKQHRGTRKDFYRVLSTSAQSKLKGQLQQNTLNKCLQVKNQALVPGWREGAAGSPCAAQSCALLRTPGLGEEKHRRALPCCGFQPGPGTAAASAPARPESLTPRCSSPAPLSETQW